MVVLVERQLYSSNVNGNFLIQSVTFRVKRQFPWQPWILLDQLGFFKAGDKYEGFPLEVDKEYTANNGGDTYFVVKTTRIE